MLELSDEWIWDSWYLHDGSQWHCWFLKAPRSLGDPALRHWNVTHGHATSTDLRNWTYHGTAFEPSASPSWDDYTIWTGSVVRGDDNVWHYFFTGTSHAENGKIQRIGHATGTDLKSWQRLGNGLCLDIIGPSARLYETEWEGRWHDRSLRDPWVMRNPDGDGWLMYFTARSSLMEDTRDAGCIGLATSPDLHKWELQPPAFVGGWGELEAHRYSRLAISGSACSACQACTSPTGTEPVWALVAAATIFSLPTTRWGRGGWLTARRSMSLTNGMLHASSTMMDCRLSASRMENPTDSVAI